MRRCQNILKEMRLQVIDKKLFELAKSYAFNYMASANQRSVFPTDDAIKNLSVFDEECPTLSSNPEEILQLLHEHGSPSTVAQIGGRYFGFVTGSSAPVAIAAKWLSDIWDQNSAYYSMSPIVSKIETVCEKWLVDLLYLPQGTAAGFVSGSSSAALCGLAAGRYELLKRQGWDVNLNGLFGAPGIRVIVGEQAHTSILRGLAVLGLGSGRIEKVPADAQGRMIAAQLPKLDHTCLVIAQAGHVNTGAFDPFDEICNCARRVGAWVHIDGAIGLWAAATTSRKALTRGIEMADSWSVDAHKLLNVPYDSGIILCKHREALFAALQSSSSPIHNSDQRDGMNYTPEMSRRARVIELWATLKYFGKEGVDELISSLCELAALFAEKLRAKGFRILNEVVLNQVIIACATPAQTLSTLENLQKSGECWCGGSVWNGEPVIRISVCSWTTTVADVERSVVAFVKARDVLDDSLLSPVK